MLNPTSVFAALGPDNWLAGTGIDLVRLCSAMGMWLLIWAGVCLLRRQFWKALVALLIGLVAAGWFRVLVWWTCL